MSETPEALPVAIPVEQPATPEPPAAEMPAATPKPRARRTRKAAELAREPDVFDDAIAAQAASPPPAANGADQPEEGQAKRAYPPLRSWAHNNAAGVELSSYSSKEKKIYEMQLRFRDGKPSQEVRQFMKDNGFRWESEAPKAGVYDVATAWVHPVGFNTGAQDRLTAERIYSGVVEMIKRERGLDQEISR